MFRKTTFFSLVCSTNLYVSEHQYSSAVAAGLLLGIGFVFPIVWWLSLIGFISLLWLLNQCSSGRKAFLVGWISVFILTACSLSWVFSVYPIDWLPEMNSSWQLGAITIYWLTSALVIGISGGLFAVCVWYAAKYLPVYLFLVPFFWASREVLGSLFFSIFILGAGSDINIKFSFGYLGYLLAEQELFLPAADWGGVYMLSFLFASLAVVLYWWFSVSRYYSEQVLGIIFLLFIILVANASSFHKETNNTPSIDKNREILIVETDFSKEEIGTMEREDIQPILFHKLFRNLDTSVVDYVLLPEGAEFISGYGNKLVARSQLRQLFSPDNSLVLVDSGTADVGAGQLVRATIYNNTAGTFQYFDKRYLVPQGEYLSYLPAKLMKLLLPENVRQTIQDRLSYVSANELGTNFKQTAEVPVLFCYASIDPKGVRNIIPAEGQPPFVVHIISHGWFHNPTVLWQQLDTMLRVQARWNGVTIINVANEATSKIYTPQGDIYKIEDLAHTVYEKVPHLKAMYISL